MSHLHDSESLKTEKQIRCTFALTADQMLNVIVFECQYSDVASDTKVKINVSKHLLLPLDLRGQVAARSCCSTVLD